MKIQRTAHILIVAMMVFVFGFSSCSKKGTEPEPAPRLKDLAPQPTEADIKGITIPQSGESKEAGVFSIRLDGLKLIKSYEGHLATTAREGMIWIEVEYSIKNNSGQEQSYIRDEDFLKLTDPAGKSYDYTFVASKWIESKGAEYPSISAHSEAKTSSFFEVPGDYSLKLSGWKFEVRNKAYSGTPASASFILK